MIINLKGVRDIDGNLFLKVTLKSTVSTIEGTLWFGPEVLNLDQIKAILNEVEEIITGVDGIEVEAKESAIYDLQGRKVMNPRKGIYIKDGKKVLIK